MAKIEVQVETCHSCHDAGYCIVHWGAACKRQGGNRIPRMKTTKIKEMDKLEARKQQPNKPEKPKKKNRIGFEMIRTKAANW